MGTRLKVVTTVKGKPALSRMMRIETEDGAIRLDVPYAPMNVEYGGFGWEWVEVDRPGRTPLVVNTGTKNRTLSFDLMLADPRGYHQHDNIDALRKIADSTKRVRLTYSGRFDNRLWHLADMSFTSEMRRAGDSAITQATVSLSFIAASDAVTSAGPVSGGVKPSSAPKKTTTTKKPASTSKAKQKRYYTVKSGDTLSKIAIKYYRDSTKWRKIADANKIKNPNSIAVGKKLYIP